MTEALATYNEELAALAKEAASAEKGAQEFVKVGQGGALSIGGAAIPGNQFAAVIVDSIHENVYYGTAYNPDEPSGPLCFAFGRDDAEMAPHPDCVKNGTAQAPKCKGCPHNEFGTATLGKGKACRNVRRLALIVAGKYGPGGYEPITEREYYETATPLFMRLPVTSVKGFKAWIAQVSGVFGVPPFAMVAKISGHPDPKTQLKVVVESVGKVEEELLPTLLARHREVRQMIDFPYTPGDAGEAPKKPGRKAKY